MAEKKTAPYGSWKSPVDATRAARQSVGLRDVMLDGGDIYWNEMRPGESGRCVVVRCSPDGDLEDAIPVGFSARTRVHEYGGGAYLPAEGRVFFANYADQRLYCADGAHAEPVTPDDGVRYADMVEDRLRGRLIAAIEEHRPEGVVNSIAAIHPDDGGRRELLVSGNDFYASPRISPDGGTLAWRTWNHPCMPWDAAELWTAPLEPDGSLGEAQRIAGGPRESIAQPEWDAHGRLYFISDRTNWWNLYRLRAGRVEQLTDLEADFAQPQWLFRMSSYGFAGEGRLACSYVRDGLWHLAVLDTATLKLQKLAQPYSTVNYLRAAGGEAVFVGGAPDRPTAVVRADLQTGETEEVRVSSRQRIAPGYVSRPEPVEFPTEGGRTAHGLFYAPANEDYEAPEGERPPLVLMAHGGPTSARTPELRVDIQYLTSRGLAVLDVNYGGSTGYGREYRERLYGEWGIVDVADCCNGAEHLAREGRVDGRRMAVSGGSAGGYTVLAALTSRDVFSAGISRYGVSDCEALARDTHKFESRYLERLIGPYPERREIYRERSPLHHADRISCPVIFFQGLEDRVVPPAQTREMVEAMRRNGLPVALLEYEGEQHGFRRAETVIRTMEAELYFLSRVFGFEPADVIEPVEIENLA